MMVEIHLLHAHCLQRPMAVTVIRHRSSHLASIKLVHGELHQNCLHLHAHFMACYKPCFVLLWLNSSVLSSLSVLCLFSELTIAHRSSRQHIKSYRWSCNHRDVLQGAAAKLGAPVKNKRLADVIAHRRDAPVRSLKWLVGIFDNILKQVDANHKQGNTANLRPLPDIAFSGFQRKYGDVMAADYMASLVNTVARYRQVSCITLYAFLQPYHVFVLLSML